MKFHKNFEKNLNYFRQFAPIKTICMHGSPLSRYDNRKLWEKYDYRDFGIIGEPYFDVDFSNVLYLTDTGRRWDGEKFSVRDKIPTYNLPTGKQAYNQQQSQPSQPSQPSHPTPLNLHPTTYNLQPPHPFHSTSDIITAVVNGSLPSRIMITIHPQR